MTPHSPPTAATTRADRVNELVELTELSLEDGALEDLTELYRFYQDGIRQVRFMLENERPALIPRPTRPYGAASTGLGTPADSGLSRVAAASKADPAAALQTAANLQAALKSDPPPTNAFLNACPLPTELDNGALTGVIYAVKDNIEVAGAPLTYGSTVLTPEISNADAAVVVALRRAGAICVAKTNMGQFACSVNTSQFGDVCNPWDLRLNPGGSSSGSAAAVASGHLDFSIGTDAGGSVRIPASLCGIVGFRPTGGSLDLRGLGGTPWTIDNFGFMTRTVPDLQQVMSALDWNTDHDLDPRKPQLGVLHDESMGKMTTEVRTVYEKAVAALPDAGCTLTEVSLEGFELAPYIVALIAYAEVGAHHRGLIRAEPEAYHPEIRRLIRFGQLIDASEYADAVRAQFVLQERYRTVMGDLDGLVLPTMPTTATVRGEDPLVPGDDPLSALFTFIRFTALFNITGHPTITIPAGLAADGLPVGLQLVGRHSRDLDLLAFAARSERELGEGAPPPYRVELSHYGRKAGVP